MVCGTSQNALEEKVPGIRRRVKVKIIVESLKPFFR